MRWLPAAAALVCCIFMALCVEIFWSNPWSVDTIDQFHQAAAGRYTDHHPPVMAALWRPFILAGAPKALLVIQIALYWVAVFLLLSFSPTKRVLTVSLAFTIFLLPTSTALLGVIWKDVHLAIAWGVAWSLLFLNVWEVRWKLLRTISAMSLILYAALVRHNAFIAAPPLILLAITGRPWFGTILRTAGAYAGIAVAILLTSQIVNYHILNASSPRTAQLSLPVYDMVAITTKTNSNVFPFEIGDPQMRQLAGCYNSKSWDAIYYRESPCRWVVGRLKDFESRGGSILAAWLKAVASHPVAYIDHRLHYAQQFFCIINCGVVVFRAYDGVVPGEAAARAYSVWMNLGKEWLFPPIFALIAGLAGFVAAWRKRSASQPYILAAIATALLNLFSYIPFGVAGDQRYAYPSFLLLAFAAACAVLTSPTNMLRRRIVAPVFSRVALQGGE